MQDVAAGQDSRTFKAISAGIPTATACQYAPDVACWWSLLQKPSPLAVLLLGAVLCSLCVPTEQQAATTAAPTPEVTKPATTPAIAATTPAAAATPAAATTAAPTPAAPKPASAKTKSKIVEIAPEADIQNDVDDIDTTGGGCTATHIHCDTKLARFSRNQRQAVASWSTVKIAALQLGPILCDVRGLVRCPAGCNHWMAHTKDLSPAAFCCICCRQVQGFPAVISLQGCSSRGRRSCRVHQRHYLSGRVRGDGRRRCGLQKQFVSSAYQLMFCKLLWDCEAVLQQRRQAKAGNAMWLNMLLDRGRLPKRTAAAG